MPDTTVEYIYIGHDNTIDLILKADDVAVDLTAVTSMTMSVGTLTVVSTNVGGSEITWAKAGYGTGEVRIKLGSQTIAAGNYQAWLVVYDLANPNGVVWGSFPVTVHAEVEN